MKAAQKRSTKQGTASKALVKLFNEIIGPMLALSQIGEGMQSADNEIPFTGHTMLEIFMALADKATDQVDEIRAAGVDKSAEKYLNQVNIALDDFVDLARVTCYEEEVKCPNAVGAALEALAIKASKQINFAAWSCGLTAIDFCIGDIGCDEFFKKAA